jgi:HSP20 family protein
MKDWSMSSGQDLMRKFQELQDRIHALMEDAILASQVDHTHGLQGPWSPAVDAYESETEFVLTLELPGIAQDQVDLQIRHGVLFLRGQRNPCAELSKQVYYRLERPSGSFERRFSLPEDVDSEKVQAQLNDGVLTVTLPKRRRQRFKVEVKKL